jgi:molybdopterin-guanine dinucleotide biosynthesis protein A
MASSRNPQAKATQPWLMQPVFCLMHRSLRDSLRDFLEKGGLKITQWAMDQPGACDCPFEQMPDGTDPFANANTLLELQALQR